MYRKEINVKNLLKDEEVSEFIPPRLPKVQGNFPYQSNQEVKGKTHE